MGTDMTAGCAFYVRAAYAAWAPDRMVPCRAPGGTGSEAWARRDFGMRLNLYWRGERDANSASRANS